MVEEMEVMPKSQKMNFQASASGDRYNGYDESPRKLWNKPKQHKKSIRDHRAGKVDKRQWGE